jgi:SAM-dependent methyltransferase
MREFAATPSIRIVSTDVSFGPLTAIICDGHDLPFADGTFDAVIVQAVLEHVVDPVRCVSEVHRVLAPHGLVYAETPFMQQVHMGPYDFTRYSHSGHRRLFRQFDEVESGVAGGPGMALAWSYQYFLLSFASSRAARGLLRAFASLTGFFLKYFDSYLVSRNGALDAAAGIYFLGRRSDRTLSDRELVRYYRGAIGTAH